MKLKTFLLALSGVALIGNVSCALFIESSNDLSATNGAIEEKDVVELAEHIEEIKIESLPAMIPFAVEEDTIDIENFKSVHELEQPVPCARNGKLVFVYYDGRMSDLFTFSFGTEDEPMPMRINENYLINDKNQGRMVTFRLPKFSPDGSKIIFSRTGKNELGAATIYTIDQDGIGNLKEIADGYSSCFSPDGQRIVATDKLSQIFTCNLNGRYKRILIPKNPKENYLNSTSHINFTPDEKEIYYIRFLFETFNYCLIIADAVTGKIIKIVHDVETASFSPDGKYIVCAYSDCKIRIIDVKSERIFENDLPTGKFIDVIWSPDGRNIFYHKLGYCGLFDISFVNGRPVLEKNINMERRITGATGFAWQPLPI